MTFKPKLLVNDAPREFRWKGKIFMPGIFDGEHVFQITPIDEKSCLFVQHERFTGVLAWLILKLIGKNTHAGFRAMNEALKQRVEAAG